MGEKWRTEFAEGDHTRKNYENKGSIYTRISAKSNRTKMCLFPGKFLNAFVIGEFNIGIIILQKRYLCEKIKRFSYISGFCRGMEHGSRWVWGPWEHWRAVLLRENKIRQKHVIATWNVNCQCEKGGPKWSEILTHLLKVKTISAEQKFTVPHSTFLIVEPWILRALLHFTYTNTKLCGCGSKTLLLTSKSTLNLGRCFYWCLYWSNKSISCSLLE